jgi:hypothetical protein
MNKRRVTAVCCFLAMCVAPTHPAARADDTKGASAQTADGKQDSLPVRLAKAQLRLAELTLQKAQQFNRKVPNTISAPLMAQFADDLETAKAQLQIVTATGSIDGYKTWLIRAELALRTAEGKLKKATEANQISRGAVDPTDVERLRLSVEVAALRWERGKSLESANNAERLQWELEMLGDGLARVTQQTIVLSQNRLSEF